MKPVGVAVIGTGFMGRVHSEAIRRVEFAELRAIVGHTAESAKALGAGFGVATATADYREVLRDPRIDVVHICTPNAQHFPMAKDALAAGKHVLCEKPLAVSREQAEELTELAGRSGLRNCICHNLRYYPMVQQIRQMREDGDLGEILIVQGTYSQDWSLYDTDWNWRVLSRAGGPSRCMADIGSHWFDMAEHLTGLRVSSLCADLQTFHPTRRRPEGAGSVETPVDTEDFGAVIFRMGARARGGVTASQMSAGRKNRLSIEVYGTKASAAWDQERPDELWIGNRDASNGIALKTPALLKGKARGYADLPGGHSEGYDDTFKQVFRRFYASIADPAAVPEYPQFVDGLRQAVLLDAELQSHQQRKWVDLPSV